MNAIREIPLIKEYRLTKVIECLKCINRFPFDRDQQRSCILSLYPEKSEKSVFRGMVIPSLRNLGLIVGYAEHIRLSANGKIIVESIKKSRLQDRVIRALIYEIDRDIFNFIKLLNENKGALKEKWINIINKDILAPNEKQKKERISHWLSLLEQANLIIVDKVLTLNNKMIQLTLKDIHLALKNIIFFKKALFNSYKILGKKTAGIVDIPDLRESVAIEFLNNGNVLTENQFDEMLRTIPFATEDYIISLGSPMGAGKLFIYKGNSFRTLSIRILKENSE